MKRFVFASLVAVLLLLVIWASIDAPEVHAQEWTKTHRVEILQSQIKTRMAKGDSTAQLSKQEMEFISSLMTGITSDGDSLASPDTETVQEIHSPDQSMTYEIRRYAQTDDRSFNGLKTDKGYQGWCEWFTIAGKLAKQGTYIDNEPVGVWNFYSSEGELDSTYNYGSGYRIYFGL